MLSHKGKYCNNDIYSSRAYIRSFLCPCMILFFLQKQDNTNHTDLHSPFFNSIMYSDCVPMSLSIFLNIDINDS